MVTKCAGIYALYNVMENKIYVGRSAKIAERFIAHRTGFRTNSIDLCMYKEPLENFAFVVLRPMWDDDYQENGELMETLFIKQAALSGIGLYNKAQVNDYVEDLDKLLKSINAKGRLTLAIKKGCGYPPWGIAQMSKIERSEVREKMNGAEGYKLENANWGWYNGRKYYQSRGAYYGTDPGRTQESEYQSCEEVAGENGRDYAPSTKGRWCENPCCCCGGKRKCFCVHSQSRMDEDGERAVCAK